MQRIGFILISLFFILFFSCKKDKLLLTGDLQFSTDTLMFDTVFTTIGSTTASFTAYNPYDSDIKLKSIRLGGINSANFRLNIDGVAAKEVKDVTIPAKDSVFIFVEVTVNPTSQNSPMVLLDSVVFQTESSVQDVKLVAWGQDVHLINGEILSTQTWTNDKPYLVYNSMLVDSLNTLTIDEGVQVYLHHSSSIYVKGTLIVNGTYDNPVVFQGDRLEEFYKDVPGQWDRIAFFEGSYNNVINYAIVKNGIIGIQVGTLGLSDKPDVEIDNTQVLNMNYAGIYSLGGNIFSTNTVVANAGFYAIALLMGGDYTFYHTTVANLWAYSNRSDPSVIITNNLLANGIYYVGDLINATFGNCIIYGNKDDELALGEDSGYGFNYLFKNCIVTNDQVDISDTSHFKNIYRNIQPKFMNFNDNDFELDTLSPAINKGNISIGNLVPLDYKGDSRTSDTAPDLGAFERIQ